MSLYVGIRNDCCDGTNTYIFSDSDKAINWARAAAYEDAKEYAISGEYEEFKHSDYLFYASYPCQEGRGSVYVIELALDGALPKRIPIEVVLRWLGKLQERVDELERKLETNGL